MVTKIGLIGAPLCDGDRERGVENAPVALRNAGLAQALRHPRAKADRVAAGVFSLRRIQAQEQSPQSFAVQRRLGWSLHTVWLAGQTFRDASDEEWSCFHERADHSIVALNQLHAS
jgi:hypothetical protein